MDKKILKQALDIIKSRNQKANQVSNMYLQKALQNPDFKDIYYKIKDGEIQNAKAEAFGQVLPYDLKKLYKEQSKILKDIGIKEQLLSPIHFCKECNDTGYVGKSRCKCLNQEINKLLFEKSGVKHKLASFDQTDTSIFDNPEQMEKVYSTLKTWSYRNNSNYQNVILSGKTGVGKTHLMECIADYTIKNGKVVYFSTAFNFNQNLLKFYTTFDNSKYEYIQDILDCDCLFIDDLGSEPILKNVTCEGLYNVISERMLNNKRTVISTNLDLNQIEDTYGERVFSRLVCRDKTLIICIENSDLRLKKWAYAHFFYIFSSRYVAILSAMWVKNAFGYL